MGEPRPSPALSSVDRALALEPPLVTTLLPGVGGAVKRRPEDFQVHEVPAYEADGREERHLLVWLRKRGWTTNAAVAEVARSLGISTRDVGVAGLKDREAITEQLISLPWSTLEGLKAFEHPDIELFDPRPHGQKLRRGHLRANRFDLVLRDPVPEPTAALTRARDKLDALRAAGGFDNIYGPQRFGREGTNLERGLSALGGSRQRKGDLMVSAGQSALFNLYVAVRRQRGLVRSALRGDLLKKTDTGGIFECAEPEVDQVRLDAGELVITGPMFGGKMKAPSAASPSAELEAEILERAGLSPDQIARLGKRVPGTRRAIQCPVEPEPIALEPPEGGLGPGLRLRFELPSGSYATSLLRELCLPLDC